MNEMIGKCRLCGISRNLCKSHVVPSFVYKWLKETSGTGLLRSGLEPNKRVQDGFKSYWLCDECEGRLNSWETEFSRQIFHPLNKGTTESILYGPWFLKFCVSVSWRVMNLILEKHGITHFPENLQKSTLMAQEIWKEFLLDKKENPGQGEQHFLPLDAIKSSSYSNIPRNINRYILRSVDIDAAWGGRSAFVYSKLGRFIILGFIEMPASRQWVGTKVHVNRGTIVVPSKYILPGQFGNYLFDRARRVTKVYGKISNKQKVISDESYRKNIDRLAISETFRAMNEDVRLFGSGAFEV